MRILLLAVAFAFAAGAAAQPATEANWPSRAIHLIVPFPAGSSPDLIARDGQLFASVAGCADAPAARASVRASRRILIGRFGVFPLLS